MLRLLTRLPPMLRLLTLPPLKLLRLTLRRPKRLLLKHPQQRLRQRTLLPRPKRLPPATDLVEIACQFRRARL